VFAPTPSQIPLGGRPRDADVYDADGRVIVQTMIDTGTYLFNYTEDANGNVIQTDVTDPRGFVRRVIFSSSGYYSGGFPISETLALGQPEQQAVLRAHVRHQQVGVDAKVGAQAQAGDAGAVRLVEGEVVGPRPAHHDLVLGAGEVLGEGGRPPGVGRTACSGCPVTGHGRPMRGRGLRGRHSGREA